MNHPLGNNRFTAYLEQWMRHLEEVERYKDLCDVDAKIRGWRQLRMQLVCEVEPNLTRESEEYKHNLQPSNFSCKPLEFPLAISVRYRIVTACYDALFEKVVSYVEQQLKDRGYGPPPVPYAFVLFGSGGRKEMLPWSDQDHGLIWQTVKEGSERLIVEQYFLRWGNEMVSALRAIGFMPCSGKVLASEALWRGSLEDWQLRAEQWIGIADWEHIRYFSIALDMRTVYGDVSLEAEWREHIRQFRVSSTSASASQTAMVRNQQHRKLAHNAFGQLIKERTHPYAGQVDLKYRIYVPIVQLIRTTSWMVDDIAHPLSTKERMEGILSTWSDGEERQIIRKLYAYWDDVMAVRWMCGAELLDGMWNGTGMIDPDQLHELQKLALRRSSQSIEKWSKVLNRRCERG
ncbi:DUF294 nucleotidyltransferase-like domain-containing protein [Paenibacillus assamensis]|uniref:DUF294 nucleotidyltransferase-like domain-containing protein n=1 Tax=Paenibacillus assamensis TaxID=311244 RepID=UPI00068497F2|nr:DUF294 nucleotidyltransferase-like domain-containing protein [Paenibacillus assamensis]